MLQKQVAALCMVMASTVAVIDFSVWRSSGDASKLGVAICMVVLTAMFGASLALRRLWPLLAALTLSITWIMIVGGAATSIPTTIAGMAMMLLLPDTLQPGVVSPRLWMALLLTAYFAGVGLRIRFRGVDFASSPAELVILVLVPGILIFVQWMLTQRIFREMRATLGESEALRRAHEQRNLELVASQRALERASAAKSQFLANMSHELRTPLNIILGYTEILQEDIADAPAAGRTWDEDLTRIRGAGVHLLSLISDVLDLSKIEAGKASIYLEPFSLATLAREVTDACQPLIRRQNNHLELDLDPQADELHTDRLKLRQILLNLLSNAAKFTVGGRITLRTRAGAPDRIVLEVQDTGTGISEEAQGRIFDAFEQADTSPTRSHGGTGLGLTLVRQFAGLLGGDVTLDSAPGRGSLFRVTIPRRPSG